MCVRDRFIGDPNKPQYIDEDDIEDEIQYISDEDVFFLDTPDEEFEFGNLDVDDEDDDDPSYDPGDEFADFLLGSEDETRIYDGMTGI